MGGGGDKKEARDHEGRGGKRGRSQREREEGGQTQNLSLRSRTKIPRTERARWKGDLVRSCSEHVEPHQTLPA